MQLTVNTRALRAALENVVPCTIEKSPRAVLGYVKLRADNNHLSLLASDMALSIRADVHQIEITEPGATLAPAKKLLDIIKRAACETVGIKADGSSVTVTMPDGRVTLGSFDIDQFPPVPIDTDEVRAGTKTTGEILAGLINKTIHAAAKENNRFAINGVLFIFSDRGVRAVSTDGRRLVIAESASGIADGTECIIPQNAVALVAKAMGDAGEVNVSVSDGQVVFSADGIAIASNVIEGNFPPYMDVVPVKTSQVIKASAKELLSLMQRAEIATSEESKGVRFKLQTDGKLTITAKSESNECALEATVENPCGFTIEIGFNPVFVSELLKACGAEHVEIMLTAPNKPMLLTAVGFKAVIMPVNLQ